MQREFLSALDEADADDGVRVVIVTGEGRGFCAGADLSKGAETFDYDNQTEADQEDRAANEGRQGGSNDWLRDGGGLLSLRIYEFNKPIIAAINGAAVGVGVTMTLPMDIRLASTKAKVGFVFSRRGIVPEACSSYFLPRVVGISKALEWAYSGAVFDAEEALNGGLVRSVHEPEDLMPAARKIAREIAENTSAVSVTMIRHMMWRMLGVDHPMEAHKIDSRGIFELGRGADAHEGVKSFLEKRSAEFSMTTSQDLPEFFPWWEDRQFE
jgi:enoyl-CoA hydratase/carnithine racemase